MRASAPRHRPIRTTTSSRSDSPPGRRAPRSAPPEAENDREPRAGLSYRLSGVEAAGIEPASTDATGRASPSSACVHVSPQSTTQAGAPLASPALESPVVGTDPPATRQASF